jgi:hypothetical protein
MFCLHAGAFAQHTVGRWELGAEGRANVWFNDYNQRIVGLGGSVHARYGFLPRLSFGIEVELAKLKTGQAPLTLEAPFDYLSLNELSVSAIGWYHLSPGRAVAPYLFGGIGVFQYRRLSGLGAYVPDARNHGSVRIPLGVGVETFTQRSLAFNFNIGYVILNNATEMIRRGLPDGYLTVGFGMNFYIGSSDNDDDDGDGLTNAHERVLGTNPTNPDTDEDSLPDGIEARKYKTDPLNPDTDGDKLKDGDEVLKYHTNPLNPDTDGDGFSDGEEVLMGTDPLDPNSHPE